LGEVNFDFHHNRASFIISKIRLRASGRPSEEMFHPLTHIDPIHYSLPEAKETGSEVDDSTFVLASFLRGEKVYESLAKHSIFHRRLTDVGNVWNNFEVFQLYSPYSRVSADSILKAISSQPDLVRYRSLGKGLCDSAVAIAPPHPGNSIRIVKIGSVREISALKHRATPIAILQRMQLVVVPLSNFYLKVRLCQDVTDDVFCRKVRECNKAVGDRLFHSFFTGSETLSLDPSQRLRRQARGEEPEDLPYFVVDCPPSQ
jgi:hypothetical protein